MNDECKNKCGLKGGKIKIRLKLFRELAGMLYPPVSALFIGGIAVVALIYSSQFIETGF